MGLRSIVLLLFVFRFIPNTITQSITISQEPGFPEARDCVRYCLDGDLWLPDIASAVGCPDRECCLCQEYMRSGASKYLSSFVYDFSTCISQDVTSAIQIYNYFCGWATPATTATQAISVPPISVEGGPVSVTHYAPGPTTTSSSSASRTTSSPTISESLIILVTASLVCIGTLVVMSL